MLWACVFSSMTSEVMGAWMSVGSRMASRTSAGSRVPSARAAHWAHGGAADDGVPPGLVDDDVGLGFGDDLATSRHVRHVGHEVAHRAAGHEQACRLARQLGGPLLERVDGGVLAEDVIADLGLGHGPAHLGSGPA